MANVQHTWRKVRNLYFYTLDSILAWQDLAPRIKVDGGVSTVWYACGRSVVRMFLSFWASALPSILAITCWRVLWHSVIVFMSEYFSFMYVRKATFGVECITYRTQTYGTYGRSLILFKYNGIPQERCWQRCGRAMLLCVCVIPCLVHISGVH